MKIRIRCAKMNDNELLAEVGRRLFATAFGAQNKPEDLAAYLAKSFSLKSKRTNWPTRPRSL